MKALHLWKKIIAAVLIILVILGTSIFLARVYLLNNIVTYYLPENASFSIGSWPLNADGVTLEDATLHIPDVISLSLKNITIGIPALIENGFLLSSLSVKDTQLELLSDKNTSTTIRLHHLQLIGIELLETPPSSKVQNEQEEGINYKISAFKVSLNKSGIRLKSPQDEQNLTVSTINVNNVAVDLSAMNAAQAEPGVKLGKLQIAGVELTITKNNELPLNISLSAVTAKQLLMASLKSIKLKAFNISDFSATSHVVARQLVIDNINLIGLSNKIVASEPSAPDSLPVKSETLRLDAMTFSGITHNYTENHNYYDKASALFTQSSLDLKKVNLVNQQQLIVDTITLDKTFLKLALDKAGILNLTDITTGNGNPEQEEANQKKLRAGIWQLFSQLFKRQQAPKSGKAAATEAASADNFLFTINTLLISNNFNISFRDITHRKPVNIKADITNLTVTNITNNAAQSNSTLVAKISMKPKGTIDAKAAFNLLDTKNFNADINVANLPLMPLSAYAESSIGYEIETGQLSSQLKIEAKKSKLNGNIDITLIKLDIRMLDKEKADKHSQSLNMPIKTVVNTLKDKYGNIHLDTPITGSLDAPDFSVNTFVASLLAKSTKEQTRKVLSLAVSPVGWVTSGLFGKSPYKQLTSLPPIEFTKNDTSLNKIDIELIDKLAQLLEDQPEFSFKLCAVTAITEADTQKARQHLALKRKANVAKALKKAGIKESSWLHCPDNTDDKNGISMVYFGS